MGKSTKPSPARLAVILKRQDPPGWGRDYIPSILATREEAPSRSRPAQIWSDKLGRYVHVLSDPEHHLALIALFHPWLFELQEQRMLHCLPSPHPLDSHPRGAGVIRRSLRGTLEVSAALGALQYHATVTMPAAKAGEAAFVLPYPWAGDFLLFLDDGNGPYCVNWTVKKSPEDFEAPPRIGRYPKDEAKSVDAQKARHRIEAVYYLDGDIRTVRLTPFDFDRHVALNLAQIILWTKRPHPFSQEQVREFIIEFRAAIGTDIPAFTLLWQMARAHGCEVYDLKVVLHQAIWHRTLRIDLFQPFHIDKPFLQEKRDPLAVYGHWFSRE